MIQNIHFSQIKKLFELDNEINSSKSNHEFVNPNCKISNKDYFRYKFNFIIKQY